MESEKEARGNEDNEGVYEASGSGSAPLYFSQGTEPKSTDCFPY